PIIHSPPRFTLFPYTTLFRSTIGALTTTTYFRAVVQNGVCTAANSSAATITVNPTTVGGSVSANQTICSGSTPADLTLSGQTGRSEEHTSELQSRSDLVCRLL